ncbi:Nuclear nucleic acid-binding protein C1D [Mycena sanguinolenta]|uniref:Exosome complex protein n=1 Tax=Mycena sanguinolenta TaxID=230812 RepID=A0A8H7CHC4_9AGAR|nr:Nuclear nucleic acid-binding protein C1D [Mycena sanguinolenta]
MTTETTKLKARLASLTASLDGLESSLAPLFAQTLPETTLALAPIEQAKLQTLLPYIVYDLVFIYLKSKGIDPKTHPVVEELTRVKKYFDKISAAENPETQRAHIDKAAATRFIKHAITQSKLGEASSADSTPQETAPSTFVPVKVTSKMIARAEHEAELRARGDASSEEDELEIIDADDVPVSGKGKGKAKEVVEEPVSAGNKRRRPVIDHFGGFGDELEAVQVAETDETEGKRKKERKKAKDDTPPDSIEEPEKPDAAPIDETDEPEKKKRKKEKKKAIGDLQSESTPVEATGEPEKKKADKRQEDEKRRWERHTL